ncbi:MAG: hypothetical protein AAGC85_02425 [Bacteroidota bacterium]
MIDYDLIYGIYKGFLSSSGAFVAISGLKGIAFCLIIINWYHQYLKSTQRLGEHSLKAPITPYDLLKGLFLIGAVASYDYLLTLMDGFLGAIENQYAAFEPGITVLESTEEEIGVEESESAESSVKEVAQFYRMITLDPTLILIPIIKGIAWILDVVVYGVFLAERFFFLGLLRVLGGLALACFAIPALQKWFWNWLGLYVAMYLLILPYFLINAFSNELYTQGKDFSLALGIISGLMETLVLITAVWLKLKLFRKSHQILFKLFT